MSNVPWQRYGRLSQSGSAISVEGDLGGTAITATATGMTSVEADGSPAGYDDLDAYA